MSLMFRVQALCMLFLLLAGAKSFAKHTGSESGIPDKQRMAQQVLDNLYRAGGFSEQSKPSVRIARQKQSGAWYKPQTNEIWIELGIFSICQSLRSDSLHALAFILSHELSHAVERKDGSEPMNFLRTQENGNSKISEEYEADLKAAFLCYLAGYQPDRILNTLLEKIYRNYGLSKIDETSYPSLKKRQGSALEVIRRTQPLIHLFDFSNVLLFNGHYEMASRCLKLILQQYQSPEILNNLGLCHVLWAMQWTDPVLDQYAYPLELDLNTGLKKIRKSRGGLTPELKALRTEQLLLGMNYFTKALELNEAYLNAHVNKMSTQSLLGNPSEAIAHFNSASKRITAVNRSPSAKLSLGIAMAILEDALAKKVFNELKNNTNDKCARFAAYNAGLLFKQHDRMLVPMQCSDFLNLDSKPIPYQDTAYFELHAERLGLAYGVKGLKKRFALLADDLTLFEMTAEQIKTPRNRLEGRKDSGWAAPNVFWASRSEGQYVRCEGTDVLYLLDQEHRVIKRFQLSDFSNTQ